MRWLGFVLFIGSASHMGCGRQRDIKVEETERGNSDQATLQGTWKIIKAEFPEGAKDADGYLMQEMEPVYRKMIFKIQGDIVTIKPPPDDPDSPGKDTVLGAAKFLTDARRSPKEVDFVPCDDKGSPLPGRNKLPGIYKFDGATLIVALGPLRPMEFKPLIVMKDRKAAEAMICVLHLKKQ